MIWNGHLENLLKVNVHVLRDGRFHLPDQATAWEISLIWKQFTCSGHLHIAVPDNKTKPDELMLREATRMNTYSTYQPIHLIGFKYV